MAKQSLFLFALLAISAAQSTKDANTTVPVFLGKHSGRLSASIITANPSMTAYSAKCEKNSEDCHFEAINITVHDKSTNEMTMTIIGGATSIANCTVYGSASCYGYLTATDIVSAGNTWYPESDVTFASLIITAGLERLKAAPSTTSGPTGISTQSSGGAKPSNTDKPNAAIKLTRSWTTMAVLGVIVFSNF
jgi:hypothetical protein